MIAGGAALIGGAVASGGAKSAANKSAKGSAAAIAEQRRQFDLMRQDLGPYRRIGTNALRTLNRNFGDTFRTSPGYEFVRDEGTRDIQGAYGAGGQGVFSGNALRALNRFNSGLASQEYGNWWNRGAGLAGIGQTATNTGVYAGQNSANNIGNLLGQQADARASGVAGSANAWGNALGGVANAFGQYWGNRPASYDEYVRIGGQGWG